MFQEVYEAGFHHGTLESRSYHQVLLYEINYWYIARFFPVTKWPWVFDLMDNNQRFLVIVLTSALMCIPLYFISSLELCLQHMWGLPPSRTIYAGINSDVVVSVICRKSPCYGYLSLHWLRNAKMYILSGTSDYRLSVRWPVGTLTPDILSQTWQVSDGEDEKRIRHVVSGHDVVVLDSNWRWDPFL